MVHWGFGFGVLWGLVLVIVGVSVFCFYDANPKKTRKFLWTWLTHKLLECFDSQASFAETSYRAEVQKQYGWKEVHQALQLK